ncbi:MAG: 30S ribosomal protein S9 [Bacilli bacterium]
MSKTDEYRATGRRKRSSAQVKMTAGTGKITVNGIDVNKYLPYETLVMDLKQPLVISDMEGKLDIDVVVKGGGFSGQTGAIRLGISRALMVMDSTLRSDLKKNKMVVRDARIKERKKYGLKKARRAPQFSKR